MFMIGVESLPRKVIFQPDGSLSFQATEVLHLTWNLDLSLYVYVGCQGGELVTDRCAGQH